MFASDRSDVGALAGRLNDLMIMKPKPSPYPLIRMGGDRDGAYLIPNDLVDIKACFSPGVNNTKTFEDELTTSHGITCHLCDYSSDIESLETPLIEPMQTFTKKWLDVDGREDSITLDEWVEGLCPDLHDDLLLQMDIEGAEYRNLLACKQSTLNRFRIIAIELHGLDSANSQVEFELRLGPLLRRLDNTHICVHAHPNNCCGEVTIEGSDLVIPRVIELTFLRRDRLIQHQNSSAYQPLLPHPLDLDYNVSERPPLLLEGAWVDERSFASESHASISTWKKVGLLSKKLDYACLQIQQLQEENRRHEHTQEKAKRRIDYLEKRLGELERPIKIYIGLKRLLKPGKREG